MLIGCAHYNSFAFAFTWFCEPVNNPQTKAKLWRLDWHMVAFTIVVPFDMLMISLEPCVYGLHIFVSSTWLTKFIFDLLWITLLLFFFTALQIWHGFKSLVVGVTCSKEHSFLSYSKTHSIVNNSNSHLCAASNLTKPQIYSISGNRKIG